MESRNQSGVLLVVKFNSSLDPAELKRRYKERFPKYRAIPGLLQKYYFHDTATDEWGGLYLWDSQASLDEFMESDLRRSIPETYQFVGSPRIESLTVTDVLRPDRT